MRRRLLLTALLLSALPACAQTPLTVQLDWKPTAQFAGILVAKQQGFYAAEGLDVTARPDDGSGVPAVEAVARHASDASGWIGVTEADLLLDANARGLPLKAFATMMQASPFALLTLQPSRLTAIASLRGKTIGLHDDGQKALDVLLQFNGMTRADVTVKPVPYSLDPLVSGQVDAMQGYTIDEAVRLRMEGHPVNIIPMSANGYVAYAEVLFAGSTFLHEHPDVLARFVRATGRGWRYAAAHPEATAQMIVASYLPEATVAEQRASLLAVLPLLRAEDPRFGMMREATWQRSVAMFERYKLVDHKLRTSQAVDYTVLRSLYGSR